MKSKTSKSQATSEQPLVQTKAATGAGNSEYIKSGPITPGTVEKTWGKEVIYQNHDKYCTKQLIINPGFSTSMHFHLEKHETMIVVDGTLVIEYINNKKIYEIKVEKYNSFVIAPGLPHKLKCLKEEAEPVRIIECSTKHFDNDSIRIG